ncbi:MAG: hypothetical protein HY685_03665 [Chloroflexi bacterium]|nr:hypothetical protein [Chloroflexota bacterium]
MMDLLRGTVKSFDSGAYTATVQVMGSVPTFLDNVKVSRGIPAAEMVAGRGCAVLFFDPANPAEAVVLGVWT